MHKRVAFHTLGCKLNYSETSTLQRRFEELGYHVVPFGTETDVIVVNTCTVTENADTECRKIIRRGLTSSPNAAVAVTGCYAQLQPEEIASIEGVSAVFGTAEKLSIAERVDDFITAEAPMIYVSDLDDATTFEGSRTSDGDSRTRSFLKLQDGCDYTCTFCTIPLARGPARAMPFNAVRRELENVAREGYHEAVLSGINLGEYKAEKGERFIDVVRLIEEMQPPFRVRISSIEPNTVSEELIDIMASSSVFVPHLHMPLQSGSAEILKKMRRRYNPDMYRKVVEYAVAKMPDMAIGIDVIVGFPGETDEEFERSFEFLRSIPFTYLHVFTYSERENTPAKDYPGTVPKNVRRARTHRLRALSEERRRAHHMRNIGTTRTFLPEHYDHSLGGWFGWTENYVRVLHKTHQLIKLGPHQLTLSELQRDHVLAH